MVDWTRIQHRVTQFFRTLFAPLLPVDEAYAAQHLTPILLHLFKKMERAEQQHGIWVCQQLEAQGDTSPDLHTAALLHDVGKILAPPFIWERVMVVLVERYLPQLAARLREGPPHGIRLAFVTRVKHPEWGAELVEKAAATPRTVDLIQRHHQPAGDDEELAVLQSIDEA